MRGYITRLHGEVVMLLDFKISYLHSVLTEIHALNFYANFIKFFAINFGIYSLKICTQFLKLGLKYLYNRSACFRPKGYQRGSRRKCHQNGAYLKQAMPKSYSPTGFEPAAFGLPVYCSTTQPTFSNCLFYVVAVLVALP